MTTRRAFLAAALAAPALAIVPGAARAQSATIGAIRVDVTRLALNGWGANAGAIKAALERELAAQLGPSLRRGGGPTLVVSVRSIFLNSYAGGGGGHWGSGSQGSDSFESEASLIGPGNRVIATYPVLSTVPASAGGPWYLQDIDQRRIANLIQVNAGWIKRYVAG